MYTGFSHIVGRTKGFLATWLALKPTRMAKAKLLSFHKGHNEGRGTSIKMKASDIEMTSREGKEFIATGKSDVVFG